MDLMHALLVSIRSLGRSRSALIIENLDLRHQLMVLQRSVNRPKLCPRDRILWVWLSRLCKAWRSYLMIVQRETVVTWHRQGFKIYGVGSLGGNPDAQRSKLKFAA